jgi:oligopeptide/dipeptide ABC transporter ATP-binding protein
MTPPPVLRIRDLDIEVATSDGPAPLVSGFGLDLHPGEIVALVGESGAGKSVAMMALLGLLPAPPFTVSSGSVLLEGRGDLLSMSRRRLRAIRGNDVAMIFQDPSLALNPVFRVGHQLTEAVRLHDHRGTRRSRALRAGELLEAVELPDPARRLRQYPHEFSGGMRQRAMIAMAIANDPRVLIADEPTTALDVTIQAQVLDLLRATIDRTGAGMILVTHDLGVVAEVADRVITMYAGRIVEEAGVHDVFDAPRHPYTRALLRSLPTLDSQAVRLESIPGHPPAPGSRLPGCAFQPRCALGGELGACRSELPPLREVGGDRRAACHLGERVEPIVRSAAVDGDR